MKIISTLFLCFTTVLLFSCSKKVEKPKPAVITQVTAILGTDSSGIDDKSFNAAGWRGITRFYGDTPENTSKRTIFYDYLVASSMDQYEPNLRLMAEGTYDLVIVTGFTWADALNVVAPDYPDQKFLIVDVDWLNNEAGNIMQTIYSEEQGSFLIGIAAALKAKETGREPKFGFIGGIPGPVITRFEIGYIQGILTVSPEAEILDYYVNSWVDPTKAKIQAETWFNNGVYAIFSAAGSSGNGTIQVAKERRLKGEDVWAIGVDSDQYGEGIYDNETQKSAVLTSMMKRVDVATELALRNVKNGHFQPETILLDLKSDGVGLPEKNPNLSLDIIRIVGSYKESVITGQTTVDRTLAEFTSPSHLGANLSLQAKD